MATFRDFLNDLISKYGQGTLADQVKSDGATLCRFKSGQGALPIHTVEALLQVGNAVIISENDLRQLQDALDTISDLWRRERRKK